MMYPPGEDQPYHAAAGDRIEHKLMPGYIMTVQATQECEVDGTRPEQHQMYQITDPEGRTDWLCAYDVRKAR